MHREHAREKWRLRQRTEGEREETKTKQRQHTEISNLRRFEQIELAAKLLDCFLWSNESNISQSERHQARWKDTARERACMAYILCKAIRTYTHEPPNHPYVYYLPRTQCHIRYLRLLDPLLASHPGGHFLEIDNRCNSIRWHWIAFHYLLGYCLQIRSFHFSLHLPLRGECIRKLFLVPEILGPSFLTHARPTSLCTRGARPRDTMGIRNTLCLFFIYYVAYICIYVVNTYTITYIDT